MNSDLAEQLADSKPRWSGVVAAVLKQDAQSLAALPALADEIRAARRSLLRSLAGMEEFLAVAPAAGRCPWRRSGKSNSPR